VIWSRQRDPEQSPLRFQCQDSRLILWKDPSGICFFFGMPFLKRISLKILRQYFLFELSLHLKNVLYVRIRHFRIISHSLYLLGALAGGRGRNSAFLCYSILLSNSYDSITGPGIQGCYSFVNRTEFETLLLLNLPRQQFHYQTWGFY